ncbi:hypothetical protein EfmAA610_19940 [Enterococcus faecium]|nr:hypothetical protein EfmAA610_19940 [Enterococcus faecium]
MTSLIGFTETLLDGAKDDPQTLTSFLEIMQKFAIRLDKLIREIIQLSKDGLRFFILIVEKSLITKLLMNY